MASKAPKQPLKGLEPRFWTCPSCHNIMAKQLRNSHCCYKSTELAIPDRPSASKSTWNCTTCGIEMCDTNRESHLHGKKHAANVRNPPRLHPNGRRCIPIREVGQAHGHVCEIPSHCYRAADAYIKPWKDANTLVTVEHMEMASNQFDGEGLLYDIDTQWGLLPHGGAYEDSEQYY